MTYATVDDLLLGDIEIPSTMNLENYITRASDDIDIALRSRYVVPIVSATGAGVTILKNVCADLASAYAIMAMAQGGEDNRVNAYALYLAQRALKTLEPFADGTDVIDGAEKVTAAPTNPNPSVSIAQEDTNSLLSGFYKVVGDPWYYPSPISPSVSRPYK